MNRREFEKFCLSAAVAAALYADKFAQARIPHGGGGGSSGTVYGYDGTIAINGATFVNGHGTPITLRGANITGSEYSIFAASNTSNAGRAFWTFQDDSAGSPGPSMTAMAPWNFNCCRIPISEANWLGNVGSPPTYYAVGATVAGGACTTYRQQIIDVVANLNSIGIYAILDCHWSNPGRFFPGNQDFMANQDNTIQYWQSIAATFGYPNGTALKMNGGTVDNRAVIFETFNEPYLDAGGTTTYQYIFQGGFWKSPYQGYNWVPGTSFASIYPYPVNTPSGAFTRDESFTSTSGVTGNISHYYLNTTTGLQSSGTQFLHLYNVSNVNNLPAGTTITGSTSGSTATIRSSAYPGQSSAGEFGWYVAGHQQMVQAIRATGAWNPCICSGAEYAGELSFEGSSWAIAAASWPPDSSSTPPTGTWTNGGSNTLWNGGPNTWPTQGQYGAIWHCYPDVASISSVAVVSGGTGYAVNDTILLPMPTTGSFAGTVPWQAQLKVTAVSGGVITAVSMNAYNGGAPGVAGGSTSQYGGGTFTGGYYYVDFVIGQPAGGPLTTPISQYSTSGSGTGATFSAVISSGGISTANFITAKSIVSTAPQVPLVITETGGHYASTFAGSPWQAEMEAAIDAGQLNGMIVWAWGPSNNYTVDYTTGGSDLSVAYDTTPGNNATAQPTNGSGSQLYNWTSTHAP